MDVHRTQERGRKRGRGRVRGALAAATLCALAGTAQARDRDHIGVRVNAGLTGLSGPGVRYLATGAAVDVPVSRVFAVVVDGQYNYQLGNHYQTLTAGVQVRPRPAWRLSPYVTIAAGIWDRYDGCPVADAYQYSSRGPCPRAYGFVGLGASMRLSGAVTAFAELRPKQFMAEGEGFESERPGIFGVRVGF